jgi:ABC-2 type transport system permease protein
VLKRWRATPLPRWAYLAGRLGATLVMALASGAVTVLVGVLGYHARVGPGAALGLLVALGFGALAWAAVGTAVSAFIPTAAAAQPLLSLSYFPVMLLSGVLGTGRPTVDAVTHALAATGSAPSVPVHDLAVLAAWAAGGLLAALRLFGWAPRAG